MPTSSKAGANPPARRKLRFSREIVIQEEPSGFGPPDPWYSDEFSKPADDLPPVDENTKRQFWDMWERSSPGLDKVEAKTSVAPDFAHEIKGCEYIATNYYVYVIARESRCSTYQRVITLQRRTGAGASLGAFGVSAGLPNFSYEVWEARIGVRRDYELRAAIIEDVYFCDGIRRTRMFEWYLGWGLVATHDPAVCGSTLLRVFENVHDASAYRNGLGGLTSYPSLGLRDDL